jgi:hypothetical protein
MGRITHLVTISPRVVLVANVLVWILDTLLKRRQVAPVLPMFVPQIPGIVSSKAESRNASTTELVSYTDHVTMRAAPMSASLDCEFWHLQCRAIAYVVIGTGHRTIGQRFKGKLTRSRSCARALE